MTVTTERLRIQKASDFVHLETYTRGERLIFSKADGDTAYVGRVYRASPLIGQGAEFSNVVTNLIKGLIDDSVIQVSLFCGPDHDASKVYLQNKVHGGGATRELVERQAAVLDAALSTGWQTDLPALNTREVIVGVAVPIPRIGSEVITDARHLHSEFLGNMRGCGFTDASAMSPEELVALYRRWGAVYRRPQAVELDHLLDIRYQIYGSDDTFDFRDRKVGVINGDTYCSAVTVKAFPENVYHGLMNLASGAPLNSGTTKDGGGQRISGPFILSTTVRVANQRKEQERLRDAIESRSPKDGKPRKELPFKLGDEDSATKLKDLVTLQKQGAKDGNKYVYVSMAGFVFGRTREEAVDASSRLIATLDKLDFDARHVVTNGLVRWAQTLPLNFSPKIAEQLQCEAVMAAEAAGCLLPVYGDYLGNTNASSKHTGRALITRRGSVYRHDPFVTNTNANGVIAGEPGSGKSGQIQDIMLTHLAEGDFVFVLDNGNSMKKLCKALNGEHNEFGGRAKFTPCLNPFTGLTDDEFDEEHGTITALHMLMAYDNIDPDPGAEIALGEAVKAAWGKAQDSAEPADVVEALKTIRDSATDATIRNQVVVAAANLIPRLTAFIESPSRGVYFRGPSTLNPRSQLTVFELGGVGGDRHLQKCINFFVLNQLMSRIKKLSGRKVIIVDEAFDILKDPAAEIVMEGLYLKGRKDKVSLWIAVQSLNKLVNETKVGRTLLNTAAWKIVLAQQPEEIDALISKKVIVSFAEDPYFGRLLKSIQTRKNVYSEALIFGNGSYEAVRLYLDKLTATVFSSEDEARFGVFALMDQGVPAMDAVRQVLGDHATARKAWLRKVVAQLKDDEGLSEREILSELQEVLE